MLIKIIFKDNQMCSHAAREPNVRVPCIAIFIEMWLMKRPLTCNVCLCGECGVCLPCCAVYAPFTVHKILTCTQSLDINFVVVSMRTMEFIACNVLSRF